MKSLLPFLAILFLFVFSQKTLAQNGAQTENVDIKISKEQSIKSLEYDKKIKAEQKKIEKEQKRISNHQKDVTRSEKAVEKTKKKITKLETTNQKTITKSNDQKLSIEEVQKLKVKSTKQELEIQKLKLSLIEQEKKLDQLKTNF